MNIIVTSRKLNDIDAIDPFIEAALVEVNGRAVAHTLTSAFEVIRAAKRAEARMDALAIPQKDRVGAVVRHVPAGPGKSYGNKSKGTVVSTSITMRRAGDGWRLTDVRRANVWPTEREVFDLSLPAAVIEAAAKRAVADLIPLTV